MAEDPEAFLQNVSDPHNESIGHLSLRDKLLTLIDSDHPHQVRESVRASWKALRTLYGIDPDMHRLAPDERTEFDRLDKLDLFEAERALRLLREELEKYPPSYIRNLRITHFRILERMIPKDSHEEITGLSFQSGLLYLTSGYSEDEDREVIHHELFHHGDYHDNGRTDWQIDDRSITPNGDISSQDLAWIMLNP